MSHLTAQIRDEMKKAMLARDEIRVTTLRGLIAACTNELVNLKRKPTDELSDEEVMAVLRRAVKQRKDSIEQFKAGGRDDLVKNEEAELSIIEPFLPAKPSPEDVKKVVLAKKAELGITDKAKMGQLMGAVMKELKDADSADVKAAVNEALAG